MKGKVMKVKKLEKTKISRLTKNTIWTVEGFF